MNNRVTPIDKILDLENEHGNSRIENENLEREQLSAQAHAKMRHTNMSDMRYGMNGGDSVNRYFEPENAMIPYNDPYMYTQQIEAPVPQMHCLDVVNHVAGCPLCSRFYNNEHRTMYVIFIIALLIIILFLSKKLLDKM